MIVGRIDTTKNRAGFDRFLIVKCNYCGDEFEAADGRHTQHGGPLAIYATMGRAAVCPQCRNDSGRRERASSARYLGEYRFNARPRAVGIAGPGVVVRAGAAITVEIKRE